MDGNPIGVFPPAGIANEKYAYWLLFGEATLMLATSAAYHPKAPLAERPIELPPDFGRSKPWTRSLAHPIIY
jgi:hypothetical protein